MAHSAAFFNSVNGDRKYNAESFCDWMSKFFSFGVFGLNDFVTTINGGMQISVSAGMAHIDGHTMKETDVTAFTVDMELAQDRIDNVVIRLDTAARDVYLAVVKGTPSENPQPPGLVRDGGVYELKIAEIYVKLNAVFILQNNITDTRNNRDVCGFVDKVGNLEGLLAQLNEKVDKIQGKSLSANDFTNAYRTKLDNAVPNAVFLKTLTVDDRTFTVPAGRNIYVSGWAPSNYDLRCPAGLITYDRLAVDCILGVTMSNGGSYYPNAWKIQTVTVSDAGKQVTAAVSTSGVVYIPPFDIYLM